MAPVLTAAGPDVVGLDAGLFADSVLGEPPADPPGHRVDLRDVTADHVAGVDAVIHLAALSNDPLGSLAPELTYDINHHASVRLARLARDAGVRRFLYASTCSVYGAAGEDWLDETSPTGPVSLYAESNLESEALLAEHLNGHGPERVLLRFATVFGASPRMRFDLVVNLLTARALRERILEVHGGEQWRPQVHVDDVASALLLALDHPAAAGRTYNVGSDALNLRIGELAHEIAARFPQARLTVSEARDPRSYRVSFARIERELGFRPRHSLADGVAEIERRIATQADFDPAAARWSNVRTLEAALR